MSDQLSLAPPHPRPSDGCACNQGSGSKAQTPGGLCNSSGSGVCVRWAWFGPAGPSQLSGLQLPCPGSFAINGKRPDTSLINRLHACHVATTGYDLKCKLLGGLPDGRARVIEWYGSNPCPGGKLPDPGCTLSLCVVGTPTNKKHGCSDTDGCTLCQRGQDHLLSFLPTTHTRTLSLQQHICPGLAQASGDIQFHTNNMPSRPGQTPGGSAGRSGEERCRVAFGGPNATRPPNRART
jgi:hypothetical protein